MWIQSLMGIVGFILIFGIVLFLSKIILKIFYPKTAKELAKDNLKTQIERLEVLKQKIEEKRIETDLRKDEIKYEKEIISANEKLAGLKEKLNSL